MKLTLSFAELQLYAFQISNPESFYYFTRIDIVIYARKLFFLSVCIYSFKVSFFYYTTLKEAFCLTASETSLKYDI